jgi:hypothetical protein
MITGRVLLSAYLLLVFGIFEAAGGYSALALAWMLASFALFVWACVLITRRRGLELPPAKAMVAALALMLVAGASRTPARYLSHPSFATWNTWLSLGYAVLCALYLQTSSRSALQRGVFVIGIALATALRVGVIIASPSPLIDVFQLAQQGAGYLLHGANPYSMPVWGSLENGHLYAFDGYAYPPGNLLLQTVTFALAHDGRFAAVLAELVFAYALWVVSRPLPLTHRELLILLFLFTPRSLFLIEQAWTEPFIVGCFGAAACLWLARRSTAAAVAVGFTLGLKQYLAVVALHFLILERRVKYWLIALAAASAAFIPFALIDVRSLWKNGLLHVMGLEFSDMTLTVASALNHWRGWRPNPTLSGLVGVAFAAGFPLALRRVPPLLRYLLSVTGTLFGTFLFGARAYGNYYYLVGALILLAMAVQVLPQAELEVGPNPPDGAP